jgi:hypothetical protein
MEISEIIIVGIGTLVSIIAFYLKKESLKIEKISSKLREIEISLAKNGARDCERWDQTQRLLEDRRQDVVKLYEKTEKLIK